MKAVSQATEAGSIRPTLADGNLAKRRLIASAPVSIRS